MLAAFEPRKRHIAFLRAFARMAQAQPNIHILLAGRGPDEALVRAEVSALGLTQRVTFCGHRSDPEALFALADLSVLTSSREGLPRVAVQSVAAGCPMLVQALPGLEEVIDHGINGWIADPDDMDAFVTRMCGILNDEALLQEMRSGARKSNLSGWALDALGARTTAIYQQVIAQKAMQLKQLASV
jgi:glycosyltransferase involved in cell wall biosynthesis